MKYLNGFFLFVKAFFPMRLTFPCYFELHILHHLIWILLHLLLREKCLNTELFLVRIFPHSNWIRRDTPYSVRMREDTDQKKFRIWTLFTQCLLSADASCKDFEFCEGKMVSLLGIIHDFLGENVGSGDGVVSCLVS